MAPPIASVRYARISREESALSLCRILRAFGYTASAQYANGGAEEVVFANGERLPWEAAREKVEQVTTQPVIPVTVLPHGEGLPLPSYETAGSAGMDLRAALDEGVVLLPGQRAVIPTGLSFAIPDGYEAQVRARSGLAAKHGIGMVNGVGTIDSDYRGELCAILINHGQDAFVINRGDRIAQLVIAPVVQIAWAVSSSLPTTSRGDGGFGSTGRN